MHCGGIGRRCCGSCAFSQARYLTQSRPLSKSLCLSAASLLAHVCSWPSSWCSANVVIVFQPVHTVLSQRLCLASPASVSLQASTSENMSAPLWPSTMGCQDHAELGVQEAGFCVAWQASEASPLMAWMSPLLSARSAAAVASQRLLPMLPPKQIPLCSQMTLPWALVCLPEGLGCWEFLILNLQTSYHDAGAGHQMQNTVSGMVHIFLRQLVGADQQCGPGLDSVHGPSRGLPASDICSCWSLACSGGGGLLKSLHLQGLHSPT